MPAPADWIEHRRGDGELVGWLRPEGDGFVAIDLLGRTVSGVLEWMTAEELLDELGIGYLADPYELLLDTGAWLRVRILEVSTERIVVKKDDWGDMTATQVTYTLGFPMPETLRVLDASGERRATTTRPNV